MDINSWLNIDYVKVCFKLIFIENTTMPQDKTSAFRGGIGEMLLLKFCTENRQCDSCALTATCRAKSIMYSDFAIKPKFVTTGESIGYVLECRDKAKKYSEGDFLNIELTLFGKNIGFLSDYYDAIKSLGEVGVGKNKSKFLIYDCIYADDIENVNLSMIKTMSLADYVSNRFIDKSNYEIRFESPLTVKYGGDIISDFDMDAILTSLLRRIYMLNCFEGHEILSPPGRNSSHFSVIDSDCIKVSVCRYSMKKKQSMHLNGIEGKVCIQTNDNTCDYLSIQDEIKLLYAAEIVHIGKNTSFGFGRIRIV